MAKRLYLFNYLRLFNDNLIFKGKSDTVYLTFDDGPHPESTDFILNELNKNNMTGSFFFLGNQVEKFPDLTKKVRDLNFFIGSHGWHHLNGWSTNNKVYFENYDKCADALETNFFRPPYGKIGLFQLLHLIKKNKIVFWSILSRDYDTNLSAAEILGTLKKITKGGDIIVFHENDKSLVNLKNVLPEYLAFLKEMKWKTGKISDLV